MKTNKLFRDNGDQTVTDLRTGLIWDQRELGLMTWFEAIKACEQMEHAGYTDWRLPSPAELESLVLRDKEEAPLLDLEFFPEVKINHYWTSEGTDALTTAYDVSFNRGKTGRRAKRLGNYVRAVRGKRSS